jgi:hypothetical protein
MKIFVSQSGEHSHAFARKLKQWITEVIPTIDHLWVSSEDIGAGDRWTACIEDAIKDAKFGILCLTKENLSSPWIHYEAGALSRERELKICPILIDCEREDLPTTLSQFQAIQADEAGLWGLVLSINRSLAAPIEEPKLKTLFEKSWTDFERYANGILMELKTKEERTKIFNDINIITMDDFVDRERNLKEGDTVSLFSNTLHYDAMYFKDVIADNLKEGVLYRYLMADDPKIKFHWTRLLRGLTEAGADRLPEGRFTQVAPLIWTTAIYEYKDTAKGIEAISILEYRFESQACIEVSRVIAEGMAERFAVFWDAAKPTES